MKTYYLQNGQEVYLKEKIGDKFIINKIYTRYDENLDEYFDIEDENSIVVDHLFDSPPKEKISSELVELEKRKDNIELEVSKLKNQKFELENDINQLESKIKNLQKTQISQDKFIINKSELINAKSLALFPRDSVMPLLVENKNNSFRRLGLSMEVELNGNEENYWGYKLYDYDQRGIYGQHLCPKYGILINPTQEQIDETIIKRLSECNFKSGNQLQSVPDKYLTQEFLKIKQDYKQQENNNRINSIKKDLERLNKELSKLEKV